MHPRDHLFPTLSRVSPVFIGLFGLLNCILNPSYNSFYLFIILLALFPTNWIIKEFIAKPIYNILKVNTLPLIGIGKRPDNANGCGFILDNIKSTTFGMPSGHSQMIFTFGTYLLCKLIDKWHNSHLSTPLTAIGYIWIIGCVALLLAIMFYIAYCRIYIDKCHTIQQVIIGSLLGTVSGFLVYYFEPDAANILEKILN